MANHRTGRARGYNGQKGGSHTVAWRDDPIILARIDVGAGAWLEKKSDPRCLEVVNDWLAKRNEPPIGIDTLRTDRQHWKELAAERPKVTVESLEQELDHLITIALEAFDSAKANNPGTLLSTARQAVMDKAKLHQVGGDQAGGTLLGLILAEISGEQEK